VTKPFIRTLSLLILLQLLTSCGYRLPTTLTLVFRLFFLPLLFQSPWTADPPELDLVLKFYFSHPPRKVKAKITLQLAVCHQSVCLGVKLLETHDHRDFP
jgi:hypothetical protein